MGTRLPSLLDRAILFAHRGARANEREHSLEAFRLAIKLGATGIQCDGWVTLDGVVVLNRDPYARRGRRQKISRVNAAGLPDGFVTLAELLEVSGDLPIRVRIDDADHGPTAIATARAMESADRLWLAHTDPEVLAAWRDVAPEVQLVNSASLDNMELGPERRAAELAAARIDAVSMSETDWSGGMVALFHRFGVLAFAEGADFERQLARLIDMGIDAVTGDHPERMAAVAATFD
ncbi:MAG: glycerophosphoryl diester phosphodiesterase [Candidatus Aldehydirespiratoraceae bacterium]|jgi:glycerophosphoryl diester phosphodiesterase